MEDKNIEDIQMSIAVLLMDIIKTDAIISCKEMDKFVKIFASYYQMAESKAIELFNNLCNQSDNLDTHIEQIKEKYQNEPMQKVTIMKHLNEMIFVDWIVDIEYAKFEKIKNALM